MTPLVYVIQKHAATRLHYDFRLEQGGVLLSWAVPKGPSRDPSVKRLAVQVDDHALEHATFEGSSRKGRGVIVWDSGTWTPNDASPEDAYRRGRLTFRIDGKRLKGTWHLMRLRMEGTTKKHWMLFKGADDEARRGDSIVDDELTSVISGRTLEEITG